jgi:hypothetical protein
MTRLSGPRTLSPAALTTGSSGIVTLTNSPLPFSGTFEALVCAMPLADEGVAGIPAEPAFRSPREL